MSSSSYETQINVGDEVYGSDGDKVGTIAEVQPTYIVVEKGFFFPTDYYIPLSAIGSVAGGQVSLNVARDVALQSGWDTIPDVAPMTATDTQTTITDVDVGGRPEVAAYEATAEDEIRIPVMEEELTATVREQEAGAVRVEKDVVTEQRTLEVPVTEERVRVERRIVDRPVAAGDVDAFEETVIDVPLTTETVEVQKQARVAEEVVLSKEAVQRTEQVTDTVRKEEVFIDEDATLIDDTEGGAPRVR
ncbi:MAG: DUF2382 domain-containing protein [Chloroflexi bacterium]|nr:DUF2382 domain-containing protein [Chloroflexota bacterium]